MSTIRVPLLAAHRDAAAVDGVRPCLEALTEALRSGLGLDWVLALLTDPLTLEVRCGVVAGADGATASLLRLAAAAEGADPQDRLAIAGPGERLTELLGADGCAAVVALPDSTGDAQGFVLLAGPAAAALTADDRSEVAHTVGVEVARARRHELASLRATYDGATGLPGPLLLDDVLRQAPTDQEVALMLVSVDQLRAVTRSFGRAAGNEMLRKVAARLIVAGGVGTSSVYRLPRGLGVLTVGPDGTAERAAALVMAAMQEPWVLGRRSVRSTCRIGLAVRTEGQVGASLVECAEAALEVAQSRSHAGVVVHEPAMTTSAHESLVLETLLQAALAKGELRVRFQPQVQISTGRVVGAEALVRWSRPSGMVTPDRFIPAAEASGLIVDLDLWVLREACRQARSWLDQGYEPLRMGVNVSSRTLASPGFAATVLAELAASGLDPTHLEVEITETLALFEGDAAVQELSVLREHGVHVAIDDFGTGYSNVGRLRDMPIDRVKIDQGFVRTIGAPAGGDICSVIVDLARTLHLDVIAEGVETEEQRAYLAGLGCAEFQGYLLSPPVDAAAFELLRS